MAWIRLSDDYNDHPKFDNLSDGAFRLWHQAIGFCRKFQTDGRIPMASLKQFKAYSAKRVKELMTPWVPNSHALWQQLDAVTVQVHDYLQWNLSRDDEQQQRQEAKQRIALGRDPELRRALRARDGSQCRYCGCDVSWADRRGATGATYDHVDPTGGDDLANLVVACRGCNSKKGRRTPTAAGMALRDVPIRDGSRSGSRSEFKTSLDVSGTGMDRDGSVQEKERDSKPRPFDPSFTPDAIGERAGKLIQHYKDLYVIHRHGARLRLIGNSLEYQDACSLVAEWDDARLEKLAILVLTTDDPFIAGTDRSFKIFAIKASWADDKLKAWEREHGVSA